MTEIRSTRLRSIRTLTLDALEMAVELLAFKIEIKSGPYVDPDKYWCLHFVIPDNADFKSVTLEE